MRSRDVCMVAALVVLVAPGAARAQCLSPWVTSDAEVSAGEAMPNTYSMEAFHESPQFKGLAPKEFCRKLFEIYYDGRRKSYRDFQVGMTLWAHTAQEPRANEELIELDPVLLLNVHGTGYCGIQSGLLEGIYQTRPGGEIGSPAIEARRWFLGGIIHSVCDAFYDGGWHYYDIDLGGWAGDEKKDVWSVADVIADPKGYYGAATTIKSKYFFGADGKGKWVEKIRKDKSYVFQDNLMVGHEMAFALRPGETFTRYFTEGAAGWSEETPFTKKLQKPMKGYFEMVYAPTAAQRRVGRLHAEGASEIFAVRVPYNISSSRVECAGSASVSVDLGRTWTPLGDDGLVAQAVNQWDYLLKVSGELRKITTRGILHPAALPRVGRTKTTMTVTKMADHQVLTYVPDWSTPEVLARVARVKGLTHNAKKTMSLNGANLTGSGEIAFPVLAPPGARIVKLAATVVAGASTRADPKNVIELYIGPEGRSTLVERSVDCSPWGLRPESRVEHWQINVNGAARLDPCERAEVKVAAPGWGRICSVRIYVGYQPVDPPRAEGTLGIHHGFDGRTAGTNLRVRDLDARPVTYTVDGGASQNEFVRMSME